MACIGLAVGVGVLIIKGGGTGGTPTGTARIMPISTSVTIPPPSITLPPTLTFTLAFTLTPTETPPPRAGETRQSPVDNMTMIYIPAGEFPMGFISGDPDAKPNEKSQHTVQLSAFWIDRTEVTNRMFALFVQATGYRTDAERHGTGTIYSINQDGIPWSMDVADVSWLHPHSPSDDISGLGNRPVVQVSWNDSSAYCKWAGRRLPTEAEWEMAARGTDGRMYPWGNTAPNKNLLNFDMQVGHSTDVGSYPGGASPYGALDMLGNAYEWVNDWYDPGYYDKSPAKDPQGPGSGSFRVIRGGAWNYGLDWTRTTSRSELDPAASVETLGFRCAQDSNP